MANVRKHSVSLFIHFDPVYKSESHSDGLKGPRGGVRFLILRGPYDS